MYQSPRTEPRRMAAPINMSQNRVYSLGENKYIVRWVIYINNSRVLTKMSI